MLRKIKMSWLRLRYGMAVADLGWMENRLHACLREQREKIDTLARRLEDDGGRSEMLAPSADDVRRSVEREAKWRGRAA